MPSVCQEASRQAAEVGEASRRVIHSLHKRVTQVLPKRLPRASAWTVASTLIGAVQLSRALGDTPEGRAVLSATKSELLARSPSVRAARRPGCPPIVSWVGAPALGAYAVTKAAAWGFTNELRLELQSQGTQVVGLHAGFIDTDMARGFDAPKTTPQGVVAQAYKAIAEGAEEIFVDEPTRQIHAGLSHSVYLKDVLAG